VTSFALMYGLHLLGWLRAPDHGERAGLDHHEHGAAAYPELDGSRAGPTVARPPEHQAATTVLPRARAAR